MHCIRFMHVCTRTQRLPEEIKSLHLIKYSASLITHYKGACQGDYIRTYHWEKIVFCPFLKKIQHFAPFFKLIREIFLFWNSILRKSSFNITIGSLKCHYRYEMIIKKSIKLEFHQLEFQNVTIGSLKRYYRIS